MTAQIAEPRRRKASARSRPSSRAAVCEVRCINEERVRRAEQAMKPSEEVEALAETLRSLGDPARLRLVWALSRQELCVCDLAALLGMSQSAVSHSLRVLRQLRIVTFRKEGRIAHYRLADTGIGDLLSQGFRLDGRGRQRGARG